MHEVAQWAILAAVTLSACQAEPASGVAEGVGGSFGQEPTPGASSGGAPLPQPAPSGNDRPVPTPIDEDTMAMGGASMDPAAPQEPQPAQGGAGPNQGGSGGRASEPLPPLDPDCVASELYGRMGELWSPEGRILDPAFAGYHTGIDPLPEVAEPARVITEFGANGTDDQDDTQAFIAGIAATEGVLLVPAGRYIITQRLEIQKSNFVLRGEGAGTTTLFFPQALGSLYGGDFSFGGGFITIRGEHQGELLAPVNANAARGATTLQVTSTQGLSPGDWVRVDQTDQGGGLLRALHGDMDSGNTGEDVGRQLFYHHSRIVGVDGDRVTLERPLPAEVNVNWSPELRAVAPTTREIGVEHLTIEMAGTTYPGHFNEEGFNAIYFQGAYDSWVRDVTILNADYGVHFNSSFFCTATGVVLDTNFNRGSLTGHHGFNASNGADILITDFDIRTRYVHDVSVEYYMYGLVVSNGRGVDLNLDHHGRAPYGTLWSNIDMGRVDRPYQSGGSSNRMPHSAAYTTLWNVYGDSPVGFPPGDFGPLANLVAVSGTNQNGARDGYTVEAIDQDALCQADLHGWALAVRKAGLRTP